MTNPRDDLMALAPCPFCHGAAYLHEHEGQRPEDTRYSVHCDECDATHDVPSKDAAVAAWNRRTATSRPATQVVDREAVAQAIDSNITRGMRVDVDFVRNATDSILSLLRPAEPVEAERKLTAEERDLLWQAQINSGEFIEDIPDAGPVEAEGVGEPVAWRYRWKVDGEWTSWRVADHSQKSEGYLSSLEETPLYAHPLAHPCTSAAVLQSHALKQALDTLAEIAAAHIPDCPAHYAGDELAWAQRHVGSLRHKAEIARNGIAAAICQLPTPERGEK